MADFRAGFEVMHNRLERNISTILGHLLGFLFEYMYKDWGVHEHGWENIHHHLWLEDAMFFMKRCSATKHWLIFQGTRFDSLCPHGH